VRLELDQDFIRNSGVRLDAEDLRLGLSLGLVSPPTAVRTARDLVAAGSADQVLHDVAELAPDDVPAVRSMLRASDPNDADLFPPQAVRKWTYLELKAAYELRTRLQDPLGVVEEIYADFDYPARVASFVRYMPVPPGAATGEDALYDRWVAYLREEQAELAGGDGRP
jgi:hypothetical protein